MNDPELIEAVQELLRGPPGIALAALWGALWGSFFNVVIVRLPAEESIVRPASRCRSCDTPLRWYDNIPLLSYALLRGRCRHCGARFSPRYALVELLVSLLAVAMHRVFLDHPGITPLELGQFFIASLFCGLLVAIAMIDLDTMLIPNAITYPGIPVCALLSAFMPLPHWWDGAVGAVGGYLLVRLFADGYRLITGRQGMGYGDAKLLAMIGGLLGWQVLLPVLFLSSLQGSVIGISALLILRRRGGGAAPADPPARQEPVARDEDERDADGEDEPPPAGLRHARIPFGPFISLAAIELIAFREPVLAFFPYFQ